MNGPFSSLSARVAICLYCAWSSRDIPGAWQHCLYDRYAWIPLLVWCLPLFMIRNSGIRSAEAEKWGSFMSGAALLCTFTGTLASLHVLQHVGLALALASWFPVSPILFIWLLSSLSWMPGLGWIGSVFFPAHVLPVRLLIASAAAGLFSYRLVTRRFPRP